MDKREGKVKPPRPPKKKFLHLAYYKFCRFIETTRSVRPFGFYKTANIKTQNSRVSIVQRL